MTASDILGDVVLTRFTLALMEDSGWYMPDYAMADVQRWGYKKKCDFFNKQCASTTTTYEEFCTT